MVSTAVAGPNMRGFGVNGSLIAVIISAVLYGIAVIISIACLRLLATSKQIYDSKRKLVALSLHIGFMLAFGTEAIVTESWGTITAINETLSGVSTSGTVNLLPVALPLTVWGADGFLIWRCLVLYQEIGRAKRAVLYAFLASLALMKLICGCMFFYYTSPAPASTEAGTNLLAVQLLVLASTSAGNILVSLLIAARLMYAHRLSAAFHPDSHPDSNSNSHHEPARRARRSPYMHALEICVESSGMIALVALVGVVATVTVSHEYSQIPPMILPQLCVISPLLIVYRIARGRESHITRRSDPSLPISAVCFTKTTTTTVSLSEEDYGRDMK